MSQAELMRAAVPEGGLYREIGFDPRIEEEGLRALADLDLARCRAAYASLASGLRFPPGRPGRAAVLLLLDVLQRAYRLAHPDGAGGAEYHAARVRLCDQFTAYTDPEDARLAFGALIEDLLEGLRQGMGSAKGLVARAQAYIQSHYQERLSLSRVAKHLHVSPNYLSRVFKRETGLTLTRYIHAVRLDRALVLLAEGDRTISEIAYEVGYQNYRDFYRNFVKHKQVSPRRLRRQLLLEHRSGPPV